MDDEFDLTVLNSGDQTRAIVMARSGLDFAVKSFAGLDLKSFTEFNARLSEAAAGRAPVKPTAVELEQFGRNLFDLVVRDDIGKIYNRLPQSHIRLNIYSNRPDLQGCSGSYSAAHAVRPNRMHFVPLCALFPRSACQRPL